MLLFSWYWADPLVSVLVALLILKSAWGVLNQATHILMEGTPLRSIMKKWEGRSIDSGSAGCARFAHLDNHLRAGFLSCHLLIEDDCDCQTILQEAIRRIEEKFRIRQHDDPGGEVPAPASGDGGVKEAPEKWSRLGISPVRGLNQRGFRRSTPPGWLFSRSGGRRGRNKGSGRPVSGSGLSPPGAAVDFSTPSRAIIRNPGSFTRSFQRVPGTATEAFVPGEGNMRSTVEYMCGSMFFFIQQRRSGLSEIYACPPAGEKL